MLAAAWITAAATGLLALFAVFTAWYARKAFREQSTEVALLQLEAQRDNQQRRRAQAAEVFTWFSAKFDDGSQTLKFTVHLRNSSRQPAYNARLLLKGGGEIWNQFVLPGEDYSSEVDPRLADTSEGIRGLRVEFLDAASVYWRRGVENGELTELCGEIDPDRDMLRCALIPGHSGLHSWGAAYDG